MIKFIDDDRTLKSVLICSRDTNEILRLEILKQALLRSSPERLPIKRPFLWCKLLQIDERKAESEFREFRMLASETLTKNVADTIQVDVNRSFTAMRGVINSYNLVNILHTYAVVDPSLNYC